MMARCNEAEQSMMDLQDPAGLKAAQDATADALAALKDLDFEGQGGLSE